MADKFKDFTFLGRDEVHVLSPIYLPRRFSRCFSTPIPTELREQAIILDKRL